MARPLTGLDMGCGDGTHLAWLRNYVSELYASDYNLVRSAGNQTGVNTRLMRKRDGRWVIALNHVSQIER